VYTLGLLNLQQENFAQAKQYFTKLVEQNARVDDAHYYLGRVAEEQGNKQEAIAEFQKVGEGEQYLESVARIAGLYAETKDLNFAREYLSSRRREINQPEGIVQLYLAEGQLLYDRAKYTDAMDLYSRGLMEYPGNIDLLYARALTAEEIDRVDLLEADLRAILEDDPNNASALNALGYTFADRNYRIHEALGFIERALKIRPDDPAVMDSMGWVQFRLGNYTKAETYLRKAFALLDDAEVIGHLGELLWAKGDHEEARKMLREALQRHPDDEYLNKLLEKYSE
jgi:tetratricopeptide (TPR) repeat protein